MLQLLPPQSILRLTQPLCQQLALGLLGLVGGIVLQFGFSKSA